METNKKAYHITTAIHDSRTSSRMIKHQVRKRREDGANPYPNIFHLTAEDDYIIVKTLKEIVEEDKLYILAFNVCADHIYLLLVCALEEIPRIMQKIKAVTSKNVNATREHAPLREKGTKKQAPLQKKEKRKACSLTWKAKKQTLMATKIRYPKRSD